MSILKIKSVGGGSGQFTEAGDFYFNIDRLTAVMTENTTGCLLVTDTSRQLPTPGNAALCFDLISSDKFAVLKAVSDAIKSNPGGEVIDLKLPSSVTITAIDALFFEV